MYMDNRPSSDDDFKVNVRVEFKSVYFISGTVVVLKVSCSDSRLGPPARSGQACICIMLNASNGMEKTETERKPCVLFVLVVKHNHLRTCMLILLPLLATNLIKQLIEVQNYHYTCRFAIMFDKN